MKHRKRSIYKLHPIIEYFSISTNLLVFCLAFTKHDRYLKKKPKQFIGKLIWYLSGL